MLPAWWSKLVRQASQRNLHYSIPRAVQTESVRAPGSFLTLEALDKENSRLLAIIDKRIGERNSLLRQVCRPKLFKEEKAVT